MPEQSYPPPSDDTGALTTPRQLNRWLDVNPQGGPLKRILGYLQLPAFEIADRWDGYSDIVTAFNISAPKNFSIKPGYEVPTNPNYVLCISYRVGNVVTRYLLWDAEGSNLNMDIPLYTGQPILKNFRFEIWNTDQGISSSASAIRWNTSVRGPFDYMYQQDYVLATNDPQVTDFWDDAVSLQNIILPDATWFELVSIGVYAYPLGMTPGLEYQYFTVPTGHPNARVYASDAFGSYSPIADAGDPPFTATVFPNIRFFLIDFTSPAPQGEAIVGASLEALDYTQIFGCPIEFPANAVSVEN